MQFVPHRERRVVIRATNGFMLCKEIIAVHCENHIRRGADKSLALPISLFAAQSKDFFWDWLKKLEQRSDKCSELGGGGSM
jgi:hypothetical protein